MIRRQRKKRDVVKVCKRGGREGKRERAHARACVRACMHAFSAEEEARRKRGRRGWDRREEGEGSAEEGGWRSGKMGRR